VLAAIIERLDNDPALCATYCTVVEGEAGIVASWYCRFARSRTLRRRRSLSRPKTGAHWFGPFYSRIFIYSTSVENLWRSVHEIRWPCPTLRLRYRPYESQSCASARFLRPPSGLTEADFEPTPKSTPNLSFIKSMTLCYSPATS